MTRIYSHGIAIFFLRRIAVLLLAIGTALLVGQFTEYPTISFIKWVREIVQPVPKIVFDDSGVPFVDYKTVSGTEIGVYKSPVQVSEALSKAAREYRDGDPSALKKIGVLGNWLLEDLAIKGDYAIFEYKVTWPKYDINPPWYSGLAQGFAAEALAEAFDITKDPRYLEGARRVLKSFFVAVEDGGITYKEESGWWFEEYAKPGHIRPYVLNGMLYALLSINRYSELIPDPEATELFDRGLLGLKSHLSKFDHGGFSKYDLVGSTAGHYHQVHIVLLRKIFAITNDPQFSLLADRWLTYDDRWFGDKLLYSPTKMTVVAFLLNLAVIVMILEAILLISLPRRHTESAADELKERVVV